MLKQLSSNWFVEPCEEGGIGFGLKYLKKLHDEQSVFQHIEIYETEMFGNLMVIDGFIMLTQRDNFIYHEMLSHPALFTHPAPKDVIIIGGGDCGTLREVLKHTTIQTVQQIEIDELVTRLAEEYFPELCAANQDPRAHFHFVDGIQWMQDAPAESCDVIIIDSTDPIGPAAGLFAKDFYQQCLRVLKPAGLMVQQSESPLLHMPLLKSMRASMQAAKFTQVQTLCFPQPTYPSGWWSATMAGNGLDLQHARLEVARRRAFITQYYNADVHHGALQLPQFMIESFRDEYTV